VNGDRFAHGGNIYASDQRAANEWLDFSANINPLGLSHSVRRTILENIDLVAHYPDPMARELKTAIAEHYRIPPESIVLGNGAAELFYLFFRAAALRSVIIPAPTFSEYERAARAAEVKVGYFPLSPQSKFMLDLEKFWQAGKDFDASVLATPNNPTGCVLSPSELREFAELTEKNGKRLLIDESFLDFLPNEADFSLRFRAAVADKIFVCRSMTKFFALPGLRLGFAVTSPAFARRMDMLKDVWNVNVLAQKAGVAALKDLTYQEAGRKFIAAEKDFLAAALSKLPGFVVFPPVANFILLDLTSTKKSGLWWARELKRYGILIRTFEAYPGLNENFVRVAVRTRDENEKLIAALTRLVELRSE